MYKVILSKNYLVTTVSVALREQVIAEYESKGYNVVIVDDEIILTRKREDEE